MNNKRLLSLALLAVTTLSAQTINGIPNQSITSIPNSSLGNSAITLNGACGITSPGATSLGATATFNGIASVNPQTGTSYTIVSSDCGKLVTFNNASAVAVTIPSASSLGSGWKVNVTNYGGGTVTITPASGTINNGATTLVLATGRSALIASDGTNWQCITTTSSTGASGVTSVAAPSGSWPSWLVPTVTNATTTPSLAVAAGNIPSSIINSGTNASSSTYLRGDMTWQSIGSVSATSVNTSNQIANLALVSGVTPGSGSLSQTVQAATCTALNSAIASAEANGQIMYLPEGTYQIYCSSGILLQSGSIVWRGTKSSCIIQYYNNAPVVTIGQVSGGGFNYYVDFDGGCFQYNAGQSGNTSANTMNIAGVADSHIRNVVLGANQGGYTFPTTPYYASGYRGLYMEPNADDDSAFASWISDFHVQGAFHDLLACGGFLEGVLFDRLYLLNGNNPYGGTAPTFGLEPGQLGPIPCTTAGTGSGACGAGLNATFNVGAGNGIQEGVFRQINIEGVYAQELVQLGSAESTVIESMHMEGDFLAGQDPSFFASQTSDPVIIGGTFQSVVIRSDYITTATGESGPRAYFVQSYNDCAWTITGAHLEWDYTGFVNVEFRIFGVTSGNPTNLIQNLRLIDVGNCPGYCELDDTMTIANGYIFPSSAVAEYRSGSGFQNSTYKSQGTTDRSHLSVGASYTHWGNQTNAYISTAGGGTVTLKDYMWPTAPGSGTKTPYGNTAVVYNNGSSTETVADGNAGTINTVASGVHGYYQFNGTAWVAVT